jgi:hypothetical protein
VDPIPLDDHLQRAAAVHAVLQLSPHLGVRWGDLDARVPSRLVEVVVDIDDEFSATLATAPSALSQQIVEAGTKADLALAVATIAEQLVDQQTRGRLGRFDFYLGDGNRVRCEPGAQPTVLACRLPEARE